MLACASLGIPYAPIVQANSELWWPHDKIRDDWVRAYKLARRVYFVSANNADLLEGQLGSTLANKVIVSNPWNIHIQSSTPWPEEGERLRLACVARLDVYAKGQDEIYRSENN